MRRLVLRVCCLLAVMSMAHAQATWDFTSGTGAPLLLPANVTGGTITATNATIAINLTSGSSGAYPGASGGNSASVGAVTGPLNPTTSSYYSFTLSPTSGNRLYASTLSLGSRSTSSGPTTLTLYSSADNFTTAISPAATVNTLGNWVVVNFSSFSLFGAANGPLTFRIYGSGGTSATAGNWRIDDLSLAVMSGPPGPAIVTQPATQTVPPGATVSLSVVAAGAGSVSYRWRKGGVALNSTTYPSATTATLNLGVVAATDSGSYDVLVTDSIATVTSSAASLTVAIIPATVTLGSLTATFDGNTHAATATTSPPGLSTSIIYNDVTANPPTNAGTYKVVATITDPAYTGSMTGNLVISPAPQTITFNPNSGFAPAVGVPFTVNATASGGTTVRFSTTNVNATTSGTNNSTITITDTSLVKIHGKTTGDSNNAAADSATDLNITAVNPVTIAGTYTQNFDALASGVPAGWHVFTNATATALGTDISGVPSSLVLTGNGTTLDWGSTTGNFRNVASALNGAANSNDPGATQLAYTNRALGVRQNSSSDPGAAMAFNFSTTGVNVTSISFSAQIVSSQADATAWLLQSGAGASPTSWTTLATFNDPGAFGATPISVTSSAFGTALNNQSNLWLRVVALTATTFGGVHDTFAIDNFSIATGPVLSIGTQPVSLTRTSGTSASFSASGAGTGAVNYQWRKNGVPISIIANPSAGTNTLSLASVLTTDSGSYDVVVSDTVGTKTSTSATLTVNPITSTIITLTGLSATYNGSPHAVTPTPSANVAVTYTGIGSTFYPSSTDAPTNPGVYQVTATFTDSEHQGITSNVLVIGGDLTAVAPAVTMSPADQSVLVGDVVNFAVAASGSPSPALQWRKDGVPITGAIGNTYTIFGAALTDAGLYDVVITNPGGSLISPAATLTVAKKAQTISFDAPAGAFNAGAPVKLSATASSGLPVSFTLVSGAGSIVGTTLTGLGVVVVVRASQAGNATAYAAADNVDRTFTFVAGGLAPFLFSAPSDQTVNAGATVTFSAAATGTPTPTWQWAKDGVALAGATNSFLTLTGVALADAARYTVTATNAVGNASASATLSVRAPPAILAQPASQNVAAGVNVTFSVSVSGFPVPTLQWRKNGVALTGAVSNPLTLVNVSAGDAARYDVVGTNSLGSVTSDAATLAVVVRDFSGTYFGAFISSSDTPGSPPTRGLVGDFALQVRTNGTAVFLAYLPALSNQPAYASTNLKVDLNGNINAPLTTFGNGNPGDLGGAVGSSSPRLPIAAALASGPTLHCTLDDATGNLVASIPELGFTLTSTRVTPSSPASAATGFYQAAFVGTADDRAYAVVAPTGLTFVLASLGGKIDSAAGSIDASGRLATDLFGTNATNLNFANGALSGTVHTATGATAVLEGASDALAGTERLANISSLANTAPGAPLIAGFVVTGAAPKQVLIRAAGPALAAAPFNVAGALDDPLLQLFRGSSVIAQNDNWGTPASGAAALTAAATKLNAFAFRNGSADAALLTTLAPGAYTVQITRSTAAGPAAGPGGSTGMVLVEVYEILDATETPGARRLANLSARGPVAAGAPLIAGFVINGTAPQRVLVRGIGPGLGAFGVPGTLANPVLTLFRGGTVLKTNDDWFRDPDANLIRDAAAKVGAFALGATSLDAAVLLYLDPGAYTAQVSGFANGSGTALVEIYEAP